MDEASPSRWFSTAPRTRRAVRLDARQRALLHAARLVLESLRPAQVEPAETTVLADRHAALVLGDEPTTAAPAPTELQLLLPHRGLGSLCLALDLLEGEPPAFGMAMAAFVHAADVVDFGFVSAPERGPADARAMKSWLAATVPGYLEQPLLVRTTIGRDGSWRRTQCLVERQDGSLRALVDESLPRWPGSRWSDAGTIVETTSFGASAPMRLPAPSHARRWLALDPGGPRPPRRRRPP